MNRELTLREKVLLLILIVLVMVLGYFKLLYEPVSDRIARCREDTAQEQLALEQNAVRLAQMEKMEQLYRPAPLLHDLPHGHLRAVARDH